MEMEPKRKKMCRSANEQKPFPVSDIDESGKNTKYIGLFTGISVEVFDAEAIKAIYDNGCFGKGSFSRSVPTILRPKKSRTMKEHQYLHRLEMAEKFDVNLEAETEDDEFLTIIPDIKEPQNEEDMVTEDVEPQLVRNPFVIKEALALSLEEAFFLHYSLKCLEIRNFENSTLSTEDIFRKFCIIKNNFLTTFVAYQYLRSKNWVVKSGLKFGGDFLLYKKGPRFYHASFVVTVQEITSKQTVTSKDLQGLYRISETSGKDLLMVDVYYPNGIDKENCIECLQQISSIEVSEHVLKRFIFEHERD